MTVRPRANPEQMFSQTLRSLGAPTEQRHPAQISEQRRLQGALLGQQDSSIEAEVAKGPSNLLICVLEELATANTTSFTLS